MLINQNMDRNFIRMLQGNSGGLFVKIVGLYFAYYTCDKKTNMMSENVELLLVMLVHVLFTGSYSLVC